MKPVQITYFDKDLKVLVENSFDRDVRHLPLEICCAMYEVAKNLPLSHPLSNRYFSGIFKNLPSCSMRTDVVTNPKNYITFLATHLDLLLQEYSFRFEEEYPIECVRNLNEYCKDKIIPEYDVLKFLTNADILATKREYRRVFTKMSLTKRKTDPSWLSEQ